jgi:hypothetical protein
MSMNRLRALHPAGSNLHGILDVSLTEWLLARRVSPVLEAATLIPNLRHSIAWLAFSVFVCASERSSIPSSLACVLHERYLVQLSIVRLHPRAARRHPACRRRRAWRHLRLFRWSRTTGQPHQSRQQPQLPRPRSRTWLC